MGKRISVHHSLTTILAFNYFLKSGCIIRITVSKPSKISWRKNGFWFGLSELAVVNLYIHPRSTISMDNERTLVAGESHVFLICLIFYLSYYVYSFFFSYFPCWFKECIWFGLIKWRSYCNSHASLIYN